MIIESPDDITVTLTNIPKNAGELAVYVFSIPPRSGISVVDEMQIYFPRTYRNFAPKTFAYEIGSEISCSVYATQSSDRSFLNYKGLL